MFKSGDIVKLKAHDKRMVVRWVREAVVNGEKEQYSATCEWFDNDLKLNQHEFKLESLELV